MCALTISAKLFIKYKKYFYKIKKTMTRFLPSRLEQERFTKMNRKSANTCLTDTINISIESFKLLLNEINQIENKNSNIIFIREDALLSKGVSNEEMASQDHHLHLCDTDKENTDGARCCCGTLNSTSAAIFSSLIDGCLKYKNKEKPKTGPRAGSRLNYDVKIVPKPGPRGVKKSGPAGAGLKCRALAFPSVEITSPPNKS